MQTRPAINILLRLIIIAVAGFALWEFSDLIWMEITLFMLTGGMFGPGFAIAAIVLAAVKQTSAIGSAVLSPRDRHTINAACRLDL
jgi:hypothetical protein